VYVKIPPIHRLMTRLAEIWSFNISLMYIFGSRMCPTAYRRRIRNVFATRALQTRAISAIARSFRRVGNHDRTYDRVKSLLASIGQCLARPIARSNPPLRVAAQTPNRPPPRGRILQQRSRNSRIRSPRRNPSRGRRPPAGDPYHGAPADISALLAQVVHVFG